MLLGDQASARTSYFHALEVAGRVRFRPELALIHLQLAELGLAQAGEPGAAQERTESRAEAERYLNVAIPELREMHMQPALARATALHDRIAAPVYPDRLTAREVEILCRIAAGRTNQEIAEDLILSIRTVERHITNLYGKIGARGKADATTYALRQGLA
jgi:DNA-binding CsgD family transcriptional regulator